MGRGRGGSGRGGGRGRGGASSAAQAAGINTLFDETTATNERFNIQTRTGREGVQGFIVGSRLGVHPSLDGGGYTISDTISGLSIGTFRTRTEAMVKARQIAPYIGNRDIRGARRGSADAVRIQSIVQGNVNVDNFTNMGLPRNTGGAFSGNSGSRFQFSSNRR